MHFRNIPQVLKRVGTVICQKPSNYPVCNFSGHFTGSRKYSNVHYSQLTSLASDLCHGREVSDILVTFIASFCISEL